MACVWIPSQKTVNNNITIVRSLRFIDPVHGNGKSGRYLTSWMENISSLSSLHSSRYLQVKSFPSHCHAARNKKWYLDPQSLCTCIMCNSETPLADPKEQVEKRSMIALKQVNVVSCRCLCHVCRADISSFSARVAAGETCFEGPMTVMVSVPFRCSTNTFQCILEEILGSSALVIPALHLVCEQVLLC